MKKFRRLLFWLRGVPRLWWVKELPLYYPQEGDGAASSFVQSSGDNPPLETDRDDLAPREQDIPSMEHLIIDRLDAIGNYLHALAPSMSETSPLVQGVAARLDAIESQLQALVQYHHVANAENTDTPDMVATLQESIESLKKQVTRAGREQLKINSVAEAQLEQTKHALEALHAADDQREQEQRALYERIQKTQAEARLDVVKKLLPVIDSLDEAMRSGKQVVQQYEQPFDEPEFVDEPSSEEMPAKRSFWERLFFTSLPEEPSVQTSLSHHQIQPHAQERFENLSTAMTRWVDGLSFMTQRMLDVLEHEHVVPIETNGQPFDPNVHVAMETTVATPEHPAGTIVMELRRGYLVGERILRHAEVVVAQARQGEEPIATSEENQEPSIEMTS